jgi:hypothetical protein
LGGEQAIGDSENIPDFEFWKNNGTVMRPTKIRVGGELPEYAPRQLATTRFIPLEQLFAAGHDSPLYNERDRTSMFYAQSWLAVEYLWFEPSRNKQLLQYFQLLDEQVSVPEAMKRAFGKEPGELDKDLLKYFHGGQVKVTHFKSPPALDNLEMKARGLDDLEARAIASLQPVGVRAGLSKRVRGGRSVPEDSDGSEPSDSGKLSESGRLVS